MLIETIDHNGYTIEFHHDECHQDPRDYDGHGLFLGFPHRRYNIGDETFNPDQAFDCPETHHDETRDDECARCGAPVNAAGGDVWASTLAELIELVARDRDARLVRPVGMIDHSGVSYYLGGGSHWSDTAGWDSGTCGLMVYTRPDMIAWGLDPDAISDDEIESQMRAELAEYTDWCNGSVYGYIIRDVNGDEIDACWGYIGWDNVVAQAKENCPDEGEVKVERLYDVRFTEADLTAIADALPALAATCRRALGLVTA